MSRTLQIAASSGTPRGEASIQPAYFTSSLFVDALRADIRELERIYSKHYYARLDKPTASNNPDSADLKPFTLFKEVWVHLGWQWLHLKILEPRAREAFLNVVLRLLLECTETTEKPMLQVVGLFALYTFYMSQPSTSVPKSLQAAQGIPIAIDNLENLLQLPQTLIGSEEALKPYVNYVLQTLRPHFLIIPASNLQAQNPSVLPREEVQNELDLEASTSNHSGKKMGRPSKAEKTQKMRAAVTDLHRWLEKSSHPSESIPGASDPAGATLWRLREEEGPQELEAVTQTKLTTHNTLSQRPLDSLNAYRERKVTAVSSLQESGHSDAIGRAGNRVLRRLKEIDAAAAEQGLEVGTEGGELSAIGRVETAMNEGRVLSLLEGGGLT